MTKVGSVPTVKSSKNSVVKQSVKVDVLPPGIINEDRSMHVTGKFFPHEFTDARGYWNWRGGALVCWLRGHRWKWTKGIYYHDGCHPWGLQCTRCRASVYAPHPQDGSNCAKWAHDVLDTLSPVEKALAILSD